MKQVRCDHCGTLYESDRTDCKNCGAPYVDKPVDSVWYDTSACYASTGLVWGSGQILAKYPSYWGGVTGGDDNERYHNTDGTYSNPSHASLAPVTYNPPDPKPNPAALVDFANDGVYPKQLPPSAENSSWMDKVKSFARRVVNMTENIPYY